MANNNPSKKTLQNTSSNIYKNIINIITFVKK
jgi:hypothetical protein